MSDAFLGELRIVSFNWAPKGWAISNGQLMPINQNQALFSLLGTTYGGNGQTTFALPDMRGNVPIHMGNGHTLGERAGSESVTLTSSTMPAHTHQVTGSGTTADSSLVGGNFWASGGQQIYATTQNTAMAPQAINNTGGSQAHENRMPFLTLNFIINLVGLFPSQN
ncbi:MAG TPA: tail fiber protein [Pyrinomonadaceae bacterium]|nr:tail fiber protein [Pyrinomonadaceae bacterium]